MDSQFFLYSGVASLLYSAYAGLRYYALSGVGLLSSQKAKDMIMSGDIGLVVDVRTKLEWDVGHYMGAVHIPVTALSKKKFASYPKNTGVLVYCNTGQRARRAAEVVRGYGFENVYYIEGTYKSIQ